MTRKDFLQSLLFAPLAVQSMKLDVLNELIPAGKAAGKMPALFLGHGNPMNAIRDNEFVREFKKLGKTLPKPAAVLCISAHWETKGTFLTAMENPKTIHDFGGFPDELFAVQYPAAGNPALAAEVSKMTENKALPDYSWGLDHGSWTVLRHLYPAADVPVVQLSLDYRMTSRQHYELATQLASLRQRNVLIVGSGNMVHNLGKVAWNRLEESGFAYDWALEANDFMKSRIVSGDHPALINYQSQGAAMKLAVPSPEHFLPLLYILAMQDKKDEISFFNDTAVAGSLTMTSVKVG